MTDSGLAVAVTLCASELCYSVGNFSPPLTRLRAWATRARLGHHSALPPYQATTPSMLGSRALGPVPSGARPLIAVASRGGTIAATSCGRVVHLLQHAQGSPTQVMGPPPVTEYMAHRPSKSLPVGSHLLGRQSLPGHGLARTPPHCQLVHRSQLGRTTSKCSK